jgi:hypothetical protein
MLRPLRIRRFIAVAAALFAARPAFAQVIAGRVVDDASGGPVPLARVTAIGEDRNGSRRTVTADDGRFALVVRGGRYRVRVARTGFASATSDVIAVGPGDTARVTVRIDPAPRRLAGITASARPRRPRIVGVYTTLVPTAELLALPIRVESGSRLLVIRGQMATPTPCYHLAGSVERTGFALTLAVQARPNGETCAPGAIGASSYKISVRLPPGAYTLRVLHTYRDDALPPSMALDTTVTVP